MRFAISPGWPQNRFQRARPDGRNALVAPHDGLTPAPESCREPRAPTWTRRGRPTASPSPSWRQQSQEDRYLRRDTADLGFLRQPRHWNFLEPRRRDSVRERRRDSSRPGVRRRGDCRHRDGHPACAKRAQAGHSSCRTESTSSITVSWANKQRRLCRLVGRQATEQQGQTRVCSIARRSSSTYLPRWPGGSLLFLRGAALMAQPFDTQADWR